MATEPPLSRVPRWWRAGITASAACAAIAFTSGAVAATIARPTAGRVAAVILLVLGLLLLAERRRAPELVVILETVLAIGIALLGGGVAGGGLFFAVVIALYHLATTGRPKRAVILAAAAGLLIGSASWYRSGNAGGLVTSVVFLAGVTAFSFYVRSRRALMDSYRERAEQAVREQRWETARAVAAERVRIARELHDIVAHHVSLLVVQAGAVRETLPPDHLTRPVLDSMIDGGRHAMSELREMLDALRLEERAAGPPAASPPPPPPVVPSPPPPAAGPSSALPLAPQPTVEEIPALVGGARSAGLPVELVVRGDPLPLPPTTSLAAYRIVQEALTNAIKHAPGAPATVELAYEPGAIDLTVRNQRAIDTTGKLAPVSSGSGYGIVGMRERAILAHGTLEVGPDLEGWRLHARLPIPSGGPSKETIESSRASADLGSE